MNLVYLVYSSIVSILAKLRTSSPSLSSSGSFPSAVYNASTNSTNSTYSTNSTTYADIALTGYELIFFAHGDWGKSGFWDNDVAGRRRLREHMHINGGDGEGEEEQDHEEEHEHDHEEEHDHKEEEFWQGRVARSMLKAANATKPEFILALGDNFYTDGVASTNDSMWNTHFRDVYFRSDELRGIPWRPVIGNHDLGYGDAGVQAQVDRTIVNTSDDDGVWSMPSTNYTFKHYIPGSSGFVQVVAVDTTWLAPSENEATDEASTNTKLARLKSQLANLYNIFQETLDPPRPTWLLVAGHYPMHSHGEKGDNEELMDYLQPFLTHYGVHAYLCGHDHINEHLSYQDIEYYVAGASSMTNTIDEDSESVSTLNWAGESTAAFSRFTATVQTLTVDYIDVNGTIIYRYLQTNANPTPTGAPSYRPTKGPTSAPSSAPSGTPTSQPTIEVTYGFCDENPDLCSSYLALSNNGTTNMTSPWSSLTASSGTTLMGVFLGMGGSVIFATILCVWYLTTPTQQDRYESIYGTKKSLVKE